MMDPVEGDDLKGQDKKHLKALEKIIQSELKHLGETRERLEQALADIKKEQESRK